MDIYNTLIYNCKRGQETTTARTARLTRHSILSRLKTNWTRRPVRAQPEKEKQSNNNSNSNTALNLQRRLRLSSVGVVGLALVSQIPLHTLLSHVVCLSLSLTTRTHACMCVCEFALNELKFVKLKQRRRQRWHRQRQRQQEQQQLAGWQRLLVIMQRRMGLVRI